jgi:putative transcriptional regulator
MSRSELLDKTIRVLQSAGFEVYFNEGMRKYFDIIAIKDFKIFIKVLTNIDNLDSSHGTELKKFSDAFSARSLVVGERAGMEKLKDGVIYHRFENSCSNLETFRKILTGETISRFTKRGQFLMSIDGEALRDMREERGMSQDDLATVLDCTGQTVYRIEKHNRIQEGLFDKLLDYFGRDIQVGAIELEEPAGKSEIKVSDPLKREIIKEYFRLKLNNTAFQTPVDFALEEKPILTPVSRTEADLRSKQRVVKGLSDILECGFVHITKEQKKRRIASISFDELHSLSSKKEIFERSE